jgi:hypothetical protein
MPKRKARRNSDRLVLQSFAESVTWCEAIHWLHCCHRWRNDLHIHHVVGGAHRIDKPWNIVRLCSSAHEWVHNRPQAGKILCWGILNSRGAFEPDTIRKAWGQCPLARIERALPEIQEDWIVSMGEELIRKYTEGEA